MLARMRRPAGAEHLAEARLTSEGFLWYTLFEVSVLSEKEEQNMIRLVRGFRGKLEDIADISRPFRVMMQTSGRAVYDTCCFGVDSSDKLSDDRYMVFYNQPAAPGNCITQSEEGRDRVYTVDIAGLPSNIVKLIFTVSIDGLGNMSEISSHRVSITQDGGICAELMLTGSDFEHEKAIIDIEIYNKKGWRISAVARGFDGGLSELLRHYGGEEAGNSGQPSAPAYNAPRPVQPQPSAPAYTAPPPVQPQPSAPAYNAPRPVQPQFSSSVYNAPPPVQPQPSAPAYNAPRPVQPQPSAPA